MKKIPMILLAMFTLSGLIDEYHISKVILFGSRANGTNRENSDVDLIIEFSKPVSLLTLSAITCKLV